MEVPEGIQLEPEPVDWQPRSLWAASRMWCGASSFFMASFVFAYFYLQALNTNHNWKVGNVSPSGGLGVAIMAVFALSAIIMWIGARRPGDSVANGVVAIGLALLGVVLQFFQYSTLGFGPSSGGYASVFFGWTSLTAISVIGCLYWMETVVVTLWRAQKNGFADTREDLVRAGYGACAMFWAYFAALIFVEYIILYIV